MKQITTILLAGTAAMFLSACGGGGNSDSTPPAPTPPAVDNSVLADDENQYGYFGDSVVFGNTKIVGGWTLFQESSEHRVTLNFWNDGDGSYQPGSGSIYYGDYGVSIDGKLIEAEYQNPSVDFSYVSLKITYKSLLKDYMRETYEDGTQETKDCFDVEVKETTLSDSGIYDNIIMCP